MEDYYEQLRAQFEKLRMSGRPRQAIVVGLEALEVAPLGQHRDISRQIGVCYGMLRQWDEAIRWYKRTLSLSVSDADVALTLKDLGKAQIGAGRYGEAEQSLAQARALLPEDSAEYGATVGFESRLYRAQGRWYGLIMRALKRAGEADAILQAADNRHYELYHLVEYASMAAQRGESELLSDLLVRAIPLAKKYGNRGHRIRLYTVDMGGHLTECVVVWMMEHWQQLGYHLRR